MSQGSSGQPPRLTSAHILVGNSSGIATDVAMSGDVTINNAGATTIASSVALAGSPTTTTQSQGDNSTKIATTAYTDTAVSAKIGDIGTPVDNTIVRADGTTGTVLQPTGVTIDDNNALYGAVDAVVTETTTARTLSASDVGKVIYCTNASACTITLPSNFAVGTKVRIVQGGSGQAQLAAASGATIASSTGWFATRAQYSEIWVEVVTNSGGSSAAYNAAGDLAANASTGSASGSAIIQSIQQCQVVINAGATTGTVTLSTAVTVANAYCHWQGTYGSVSTFAADTCLASVTLTNTTTVTATRNTSDASNSVTVMCTVVEFKSGVIQKIQQGTVALGSGVTSANTAITAVVANNTFVHFQGQTFNSTTDNANFARCMGKVALSGTTNVNATRNTSSTSTLTVGFVAVEFVASTVLKQAVVTASASATTAAINGSTGMDALDSFIVYGGTTTTSTNADKNAGGAGLVSQVAGKLYYVGQATTNLTAVEFLAGSIKSTQTRATTIAATATAKTDTIQSVNTGKTLLAVGGDYPTTSLSAFNTAWAGTSLASSTTVTCTRGAAHATITNTTYYQVVEFN